MRLVFSIVFFYIVLQANADQFTVFEKDGYFGIKDDTGNVTVPPVYDKLGWSDGKDHVLNGVIGFRSNNLWGLITVRNKELTSQKFYTIQPLNSGYFKASVKGNFSNRLFYGILNAKGETVISFNYFSIEEQGADWLVGDFSNGRELFGLVSYSNEIKIPLEYLSIKVDRELIFAQQLNNNYSLFSKRGLQLQKGIDSAKYQNGWIVYRDGYAGFLSEEGHVIHPYEYKSISLEGGLVHPISFNEWTIYKKNRIQMEWKCDSLTLNKNGVLTAHLNGAQHFLINNETLKEHHELVLKEVSGEDMIVQNSRTELWSVLKKDGTERLAGYDSIHGNSRHYIVKDGDKFSLFSRDGISIGGLPNQKLKEGVAGQYIIKRNGYWGILSEEDGLIARCKYDSLLKSGDVYLVSYLNRWGVMNESGEWSIKPQFNEVYSMGNLIIGRRGLGYTIFLDAEKKWITTFKPIRLLKAATLILDEKNKYGLLNQFGELMIYPEYDEIRSVGNFFELVKGEEVSLVTDLGKLIIDPGEGYQRIEEFSDDYFLVRKENRWGFTDIQGRLRVSNRYDSARSFKQGFAPVLLRNKWGFIDKTEKLVIQPYYNTAASFENGLAIVEIDGRFGLIDQHGKEALKVSWQNIVRLSTGNYRVEDANGRVGLVNRQGSFILRPAYHRLIDLKGRVLVQNNNVWGILSYSGEQIFKINNKDIDVTGDYVMLMN